MRDTWVSTIVRALEVLLWPRIMLEITEKIKNCPVCLKIDQVSSLNHWSHTRLHHCRGLILAQIYSVQEWWNYLGTIDYYSKWPELTLLPSVTSMGVIAALKSQFVRYGVPSVVVSDNDHCYNSVEFRMFSEDWSFEYRGMSLQVLATHKPTASQREPSRPLKQCWRKLMTHTVLSFHTRIHLWRKWTRHLPCTNANEQMFEILNSSDWLCWNVYSMILKRSSLS